MMGSRFTRARCGHTDGGGEASSGPNGDVARTVAFLAGEDSGFTTGHYIPVDGGVSMD